MRLSRTACHCCAFSRLNFLLRCAVFHDCVIFLRLRFFYFELSRLLCFFAIALTRLRCFPSLLIPVSLLLIHFFMCRSFSLISWKRRDFLEQILFFPWNFVFSFMRLRSCRLGNFEKHCFNGIYSCMCGTGNRFYKRKQKIKIKLTDSCRRFKNLPYYFFTCRIVFDMPYYFWHALFFWHAILFLTK